MDISIHRPSMDHDTWRWLLLLRFAKEEECSQHDLPQYDDCCHGLLSGLLSFMASLCVLIDIVVVLLGLFSSFQRHCQSLHWRPQYASPQNSMFPLLTAIR